MFTQRPERLIGSAALASLLGGVPLALIFSMWGAIEGGMSISPLHFVGWAFGIAGICFALSFIIAVPSLALLRRLGVGGPASALIVGSLPGVISLAEGDLRFGVFALVTGLVVSALFCRFAYDHE